MQINGALLSSAFVSPRSSETREPLRPPVIIDVEPSFRDVRPLLPTTTKASAYQTALTVDDQRQGQFVRLFAQRGAAEDETQTAASALPKGIQQYLKIADLETDPQQSLFDALV